MNYSVLSFLFIWKKKNYSAGFIPFVLMSYKKWCCFPERCWNSPSSCCTTPMICTAQGCSVGCSTPWIYLTKGLIEITAQTVYVPSLDSSVINMPFSLVQNAFKHEIIFLLLYALENIFTFLKVLPLGKICLQVSWLSFAMVLYI